MANLKKYTFAGKEAGTAEVPDSIAQAEANSQMIKDYIVAIRNNLRQWSASTKTRAEVAHTTHKPHRQKGTGNARQGSLVSPQYRGGGRAFGPRPKFNQHVRINKKERQAAIRALIGEKIRDGKVVVVENLEMEQPKTKEVVQFNSNVGIKGRTLFLGEGEYLTFNYEDGSATAFSIPTLKYENFQRSINNLPKTEFKLAKNVSGYDILCAENIILTEKGLEEMVDWLLKKGEQHVAAN